MKKLALDREREREKLAPDRDEEAGTRQREGSWYQTEMKKLIPDIGEEACTR